MSVRSSTLILMYVLDLGLVGWSAGMRVGDIGISTIR